MAIPEGFKLVESPSNIPQGFKLVEPQITEPTLEPTPEQPPQDVSFTEGLQAGALRGFEQGTAGPLQRVAELRLSQLNEKVDKLAVDMQEGRVPATQENIERLNLMQDEQVKVAQALKGAEGVETGKREAFEQVQEGAPVSSTLGNIAGQLVSQPIPGGAGPTLGARALTSAGGGAVAGFLQPTTGEESAIDNALITGGLSLGLSALSEPLIQIAKRFSNSIAGKFEAENVKDLIDIAEREGIEIFSPDIARAPFASKAGTLAEEIPIVGPARDRIRQNLQQKDAAERIAAEFGDNIEDFGTVTQAGMRNQLQRFKKISSRLFNKASAELDPLGSVPTSRFDKMLAKSIAKEETRGTRANPKLIAELESFRDAPRGNFSSIRDLRADLGDVIRDFNRGVEAGVGTKGIGLLQSAKEQLEQDLEEFAVKEGGQKGLKAFRNANSFYRENVVPFKKGALKNLIETGEPEKIISFLSQQRAEGGRVSRAELLFKGLDKKGRQAVRGALISKALNKALPDPDGTFSPAKFSSEIESLQNVTGVFFDKADKVRLDGLAKVMKATQRAGQIAENPPTGARLALPAVLGFGAMSLGSTIAILGGMGTTARIIYNNPGLRNLLAAASTETPGSKKFQNILVAINTGLTKEAAASNE